MKKRHVVAAALMVAVFGIGFTLFADFDDTDWGRGGCGYGGKPGAGRGFIHDPVILKHELDLDNTQYESLKAVAEQYAEQRYALREKRDHEGMRELQKRHKEEVAALLTPDQLKNLKELSGVKRAERMRFRFDLTEDQYRKILSITKEYAIKAYDLRGTANKDVMRDLMYNQRIEIERVLTDEQKKDMYGRGKRPGGRRPLQ